VFADEGAESEHKTGVSLHITNITTHIKQLGVVINLGCSKCYNIWEI